MPYQMRLNLEETNPKDYLERAFREACSWRAFTFNRDDYKWKYETMICKLPFGVLIHSKIVNQDESAAH